MNDRNRGWSTEMHAGASTSPNSFSAACAAEAVLGDRLSGEPVELRARLRPVERDGIQPQPVPVV